MPPGFYDPFTSSPSPSPPQNPPPAQSGAAPVTTHAPLPSLLSGRVSVPGWALLAVAALFAFAFVVVVGAGFLFFAGGPSRPNAVAVGRSYVPVLGKSYAKAWEDGAAILEAGQPVDTAISTVAKAWEGNRTKEFTARVSPVFSSVIPDGADEAKITTEKRRELARTWRDFAKGLKGQ